MIADAVNRIRQMEVFYAVELCQITGAESAPRQWVCVLTKRTQSCFHEQRINGGHGARCCKTCVGAYVDYVIGKRYRSSKN